MNDRAKLFASRVFDPTAVPILSKTPVDATLQIGKRAYRLYEQYGHREGHVGRDWLQAAREIRNDENASSYPSWGERTL